MYGPGLWSFHAYPAKGAMVVLIDSALKLQDFGTVDGTMLFVWVGQHGDSHVVHSHTLEGVEPVCVVYLYNQPRQTSEFPRPEPHRNLCSKPGFKVTPMIMAGGFLAMVAADGGCILCE